MGKFTETFNDEQEKTLLGLFVTKPYSDVFGVYDGLLSGEQFATFGASYSRTHRPFQQQLMTAIDAGDILDSDLLKLTLAMPAVKKEVEREFEKLYGDKKDDAFSYALRKALKTPDFISLLDQFKAVPEKAGAFIKKWAQDYGHNSIKEMGMLRFCCENIPDYTGKHITGHPLAHPQVKSSRYIDWSKVLHLAEENEDIKNSKYASEIITTLRALSEGYAELSDECWEYVRKAPINQEYLASQLEPSALEKAVKGGKTVEDEKTKRIKAYDRDTKKSVFDTTRYLLTPSMLTSLACAVDARSMEDILTSLLSSPMREDQKLGQTLWDETRKVLPVLLGEKCHAGRNEYAIRTREALEKLVQDTFPFEKTRDYEVTKRTNFIDPKEVDMFGDTQLAASIAFSHGHGSFMQYYSFLKKNPNHVAKIIDVAFEGRDNHDPAPSDLGQGGAMREFLMDYGGYRDVFRHRRGSRSRQLLSTYHGFETPRLIDVAGLNKKYDALNMLSDATFRKVAEEEPHVAQTIVTFAHKCRSLYSWSPQQDIYFVELRGKPTANHSYRTIAWDVGKELQRRAPITGRHLRMDYKEYPPELTNGARKWYDSNKRS